MKYGSAVLNYHTAPFLQSRNQILHIFRIDARTGAHTDIFSGIHFLFQILSSRYKVALHTVRYNYIVQLSRIGGLALADNYYRVTYPAQFIDRASAAH